MLRKIVPFICLLFFSCNTSDEKKSEKIIIHEAKKLKISSIMLQHGAPHIFLPKWAEFNPMSGTLPVYNEKMAVWGSVMKEYALDNGMNEDSIIVSGSTRHDSYFKANSHNDKGIILVALLPYYFKSSIDQSIDSFKKYEESLKIICNTLKKITDRKKIIKLHPTDMKFLSIPVELIIRNIDPSIQIVVDADLSKLIPSADIVITLGLTTFILDSNVFHKPTVTLLYDHEEFVSKLSHGYSEVFKNHEAKKFELYIQNILVNEKLRNENIEKGSDFLYSYLSNHGNASEYLANKVFDELI